MGNRNHGLGFRGLGFRMHGLGFGLGFRIHLGFLFRISCRFRKA